MSGRRAPNRNVALSEKKPRFKADDPAEMIAFARSLVLSSGQYLRGLRATTVVEMHEKDGPEDIVTDHDVWIQNRLTAEIALRYPRHALIAEEGVEARGRCEWTWVIDPIDGTTNYCLAGERYAISVGLMHFGAPYYGLVLDVSSGCLHEGRFSREEPGASSESSERSFLYLGFKTIRDLASLGGDPLGLGVRFMGVRAWGCASLELCEIARMRSGFYLSSRLRLWDFAAAASILSAAGCTLRAVPLDGGRWLVAAFHSPKLLNDCAHFLPEPLRQKLLAPSGGGYIHAVD